MIKRSIHQNNITILSVYAPNKGASWYMSQKLIELKEEMDNLTILYVTPWSSKIYPGNASLILK